MHLPARTTAGPGDGRPGEPGAALAINKPVTGERRSVTQGRACAPGVTEAPLAGDTCDMKRVFVTRPPQRRARGRRRGGLTRRPGEAVPGAGPKTRKRTAPPERGSDQAARKALS
ncbi:hypothetical protein GCM10010384_25280 [Streptomyces djakartensis]|uniref:Uncharacterized protein n=1 Tax=Streptomyces djakartensis TaxID=68193 RepID=A0ABQ2ZKT4_9ACTN|nr:hypothetical protein GCM10010384_25280 [Streptomyces djakartensis]